MMNEEVNKTLAKKIRLLDWASAFEAGSGMVGGKAWNLSRLHRYGFNVPNGGVFPVTVYSQFIADDALSLKMVQATEKSH